MSTASASAKTWLVPVATATYGYALTKPAWKVTLLGLAAVALFAYIDAYYLQLERGFRDLYRRATGTLRQGESRPAGYDMKPPSSRWPTDAWGSPSIWPFYGALIVVGLLVVLVARP